MSPLRTAALALAAKGPAVFPLRPRTKEPYSDDKFYRTIGGYKAATRDPALVEFWWSRHPDNNIGIATGSVSAIWVLDVDGNQGRETLASLEEQHGQLPPTVEVVTPGKINKKTGEHTGKGLHLYFRYPLGLDIRNAQHRDDVPGLDWRGNGGYVCAPPSVHPDGTGNYAWSVDSANEFADAPGWLIELVTNKSRGNGAAGSAHVREIDEKHGGSQRGLQVASFSGVLLRAGYHPFVVLDQAQRFNATCCEPPLTDEEVIRTVTDITRLEKKRQERTPP